MAEEVVSPSLLPEDIVEPLSPEVLLLQQFSLGMEEWSVSGPVAMSNTSDGSATVRKPLKLTLNKKNTNGPQPKKRRFGEIVSEEDLETASAGVLPKNTEKNDR